ncbi:DMT family transporter [Rubellimicrobium roseum]|uniref:DMT family transporter n=1 Tax=Rubellimicrobium roseum TaxID=687525 RepID=A0A5C4NC55_9RHOB|nr:DMT family transporter [Rubellimicrobium roseum]TNC68041.1 DMT family transporter [Rubellimicrobium roseum]
MTVRAPLTANQRGIVLMIAGMAGFALEDMFIKLLAAHVPTGEILMVIGLAGALIFGAVAARRGGRFWSRGLLHWAVVGRNLSEMLGTCGYVLAIALSPLTTATAIFQATPLAVTMGAAVFLGEHVGWRRWVAIAVGFFGVMMIVRPGSEAFTPASLFALMAVVGLGGRDLFTRRVPQDIDSMLLVAWGFGAVGIVGLGQIAVTGGAVMPTGVEGVWLIGALLTGAAGYWALTEAMRAGEISVITPFRYSRLLFALGIGITIFDERPDLWTLAGAALIVGSGLYSLLRERARARAAARATLSPVTVPR